jgi:heat shock protein HslJ
MRLWTLLLTIPAMAQLDPAKLDHTKWLLEGGKLSLQFQGNRVSFKACNNHGGTFTLTGGTLKASRMVSTMMACADNALMELDRKMATALESGVSASLMGDQLTLKPGTGDAMVFSKQPSPSAAAVTKFIYVASEMKPCTGVGPMMCYQIREDPKEPWRLSYLPIIGFDFQPGTEYRLRIKEDKRQPPIPADAAGVIWYLDLVVEQKIVKKA